MTPEPAVPVARLENLWRRLRQLRGMANADARRANGARQPRMALFHGAVANTYRCAAADLRAVIDEAKGET